MNVPLFNLTRQYRSLRGDILRDIDRVISSGCVILGPENEHFSKELQQYLHVNHAIGVSSGTDALVIALKAFGISKDDLVITTPYSFFSTASCIVRLEAKPLFIDINLSDYNISIERLRDFFEHDDRASKVKAIIPVHLFGKVADMNNIMEMARRYDIKVLEDCAQAIGAKYKVATGDLRFAGTIGDAGILSFYPTKNLGAYGDGGAILTNDDAIYSTSRMLRVHGSKDKYYHEMVGYNARLDEIQAAVLRLKLRYLDEWIEKRRNAARTYAHLFGEYQLDEYLDYPVLDLEYYPDHVFHQYVVRCKEENVRDNLRRYLTSKGIGTLIYYPVPLHLQECFAYLRYKEGDMPNAEKAAKTTIAIPMFPEITEEEQRYVVNTIQDFFKVGR